jgi:hypothetical protein
MVQAGKYRERWTLDAWNKAFVDIGTSKQADNFLLEQGIKVKRDLDNIPVEALRCVGFTKLYEAGRVDEVTEGEGGGGRVDSQELTIRHNNLYPGLNDPDDNVAPTEANGMHIFLKLDWDDDPVQLQVLPSDRISDVKAKIFGLHGTVTFLTLVSTWTKALLRLCKWKYGTHPVHREHLL